MLALKHKADFPLVCIERLLSEPPRSAWAEEQTFMHITLSDRYQHIGVIIHKY